jgi:hypothetical protein
MYATENVETCVYFDTKHSDTWTYRHCTIGIAVVAVTPSPV